MAAAIRRGWQRFRSGGVLLPAGAALVGFVLLALAAGPSLTGWGQNQMDYTALLQSPSWAHPFGTDSFGRDVLSRVLYGARVSLLVSVGGVVVAAVVGTLTGMAAAMLGGFADTVTMRAVDLLLALPSFVLALFLMLILGFGLVNVALALALIFLPNFARLARNTTLAVASENYIQAAVVIGQPPWRITLREILPNIAAPLSVQFSTALAFGMLVEAGLSFLGLGVQPPTPSLGGLMSEGKDYFESGPWVLTCTGLTVSTIILGLNLLADGIRDVLDPRLRRIAG